MNRVDEINYQMQRLEIEKDKILKESFYSFKKSIVGNCYCIEDENEGSTLWVFIHHEDKFWGNLVGVVIREYSCNTTIYGENFINTIDDNILRKIQYLPKDEMTKIPFSKFASKLKDIKSILNDIIKDYDKEW